MPEKRYLLTPGPTPVPPQVLAALAEPVSTTAAPDFARVRRVPRAAAAGLPDRATTSCSSPPPGTGAFESRGREPARPGDRVLVVSAGNFGERWATMCEAYGADVVPLAYEWGETPAPDDLARDARRRGATSSAVFLTHSETSTGVVADVQALAAASRRRPARSSSSTRSRASARCRSRPTRGASTSSSPARRRR